MHIVKKEMKNEDHFSLSCNTSCPPTTTQWYKNRDPKETSGTVTESSEDNFMCAVKGNKDLQSAEVCEYQQTCLLKTENKITL